MTMISSSLLSDKMDIVYMVKLLDKTNVDYVHIDVMDGHFVDNNAFSITDIKKIIKYTSKPLDVHLMVKNPKKYIEQLALYNVSYITFHYEISDNINYYIDLVKQYGIKCGISLKPRTDVEKIYPFLNKIDMVLIMSVEPGYGGQPFLENAILKIKKLRDYNAKIVIEVDGGINNINAKQCIEAGANILVSGSYITNSNDYQRAIDELRN